jgi:hypothetical protein
MVKTTILKGIMEIISYTLPPITNNRWWRDAEFMKGGKRDGEGRSKSGRLSKS